MQLIDNFSVLIYLRVLKDRDTTLKPETSVSRKSGPLAFRAQANRYLLLTLPLSHSRNRWKGTPWSPRPGERLLPCAHMLFSHGENEVWAVTEEEAGTASLPSRDRHSAWGSRRSF